MNEVFTYAFVALLIWLGFYGIYLNFVLPVILTRLRFKAAEALDELEDLVRAKKEEATARAVAVLRHRGHIASTELPHFNLTNLALAHSYQMLMTRVEVDADDAEINKGGEELLRIGRVFDASVLGAFAANSPVLLGSVIVILLGLAMWMSFASKLIAKFKNLSWGTAYNTDKELSICATA